MRTKRMPPVNTKHTVNITEKTKIGQLWHFLPRASGLQKCSSSCFQFLLKQMLEAHTVMSR
ncbi:unnamed protein product [Ixodes hexagonus]